MHQVPFSILKCSLSVCSRDIKIKFEIRQQSECSLIKINIWLLIYNKESNKRKYHKIFNSNKNSIKTFKDMKKDKQTNFKPYPAGTKMISLCHQHRARPVCKSKQADQALTLYCWLTFFKFSSTIMDSSKNRRCIPFNKFSRLRVKWKFLKTKGSIHTYFKFIDPGRFISQIFLHWVYLILIFWHSLLILWK